MIKNKQTSFKVSRAWNYEIVVFILKCVSITNKVYYMEGIIRSQQQQQKKKQAVNEKQACFEKLYWVVFQFFMQKHTWQNDTSWCTIISTKNTMQVVTLNKVLNNYGLI